MPDGVKSFGYVQNESSAVYCIVSKADEIDSQRLEVVDELWRDLSGIKTGNLDYYYLIELLW